MFVATPLIIIALFHVGIGITDTDDMYRCPSEIRGNWYTRTYGDMCYLFINSERTWVDAQNDCSRRGGNLITIQTAGIQTFVERNLQALNWRRNGLWIGANDRHREWHWVWVTGEAVASGYRKWAPDQPSCYFFTTCHEDCANLRLNDGYRWHDYPCDMPGVYEYSYICQFRMMAKITTAATTTTSTAATTSGSISTRLPMQPLRPLLRITTTMATTPAMSSLKSHSSFEPFSTTLPGIKKTKITPTSPWSVELGSVLDVDKNSTGEVLGMMAKTTTAATTTTNTTAATTTTSTTAATTTTSTTAATTTTSTTAATTTSSTTATTSGRISTRLPMQPLRPLLRITTTMATTPAMSSLKSHSSVEPFSTSLPGIKKTKIPPTSPWSVELTSVLDVDKNSRGQELDSVDVKVEHQHLASVDAGIQTEGIIVTLVLVFIAGLIIGLLIYRRRRRKCYSEGYSVEFNNITYAEQPKQQSNRIKNTNAGHLLNTADATDESDIDESVRCAEIDDIKPKCNVELPEEKEGACGCDNSQKMIESPYEEIHADVKKSREGNSDDLSHLGASGSSPCTPEFLKKDAHVALTYSKNLYSMKF